MKTLLNIMLMAIVILISWGCQSEVKSNITVTKKLSFIDDDGDIQNVKQGKYSMKLAIDLYGKENSELTIYLDNSYFFPKTASIPIKLPPARTLLQLNAPKLLTPYQTNQMFKVSITRTPGRREDSFLVQFVDRNSDTVLAQTSFKYKSSEAMYNKTSMTFLRSYQEVSRGQRGLVFAIDSDAGKVFGFENEVSKAITAHVVDYLGMIYIAPWVHVAYDNVNWIIGKDQSPTYLKEQWKELIDDYPVVDYMSTVHSGTQMKLSAPLDNLRLKRNQLRLVYTGACRSADSKVYIKDHNAAIGVGHKAISMSPFLSYSFIRSWTYGNTVASSVDSAWTWGKVKIRAAATLLFAQFWQEAQGGFFVWKNIDHAVDSSEMLISYTTEISPYNLTIDDSAVPLRNTPSRSEIKSLAARNIES